MTAPQSPSAAATGRQPDPTGFFGYKRSSRHRVQRHPVHEVSGILEDARGTVATKLPLCIPSVPFRGTRVPFPGPLEAFTQSTLHLGREAGKAFPCKLQLEPSRPNSCATSICSMTAAVHASKCCPMQTVAASPRHCSPLLWLPVTARTETVADVQKAGLELFCGVLHGVVSCATNGSGWSQTCWRPVQSQACCRLRLCTEQQVHLPEASAITASQLKSLQEH